MGWSAGWVAVQAQKAKVLEALRFVETGETGLPGEGRAGWSCLESEGWTIVFGEDRDWTTRRRAAELSFIGRVVACRFEDRVEMASEAWEVRGGVELWRVFHDNTQSIFRLDVEGEPPAALAEIRDRLTHEQAADGGERASADYMHDAPLELAKSVCGFRAGDDLRMFEALRPVDAPAGETPKSRPGLFARLFGGGRR